MTRFDDNIILLTDSYKLTHHRLLPPEVRKVYSYLESRGGRWPETVFFGLQPILNRIAGQVVTADKINEAEQFCAAHFGDPTIFNRKGWEHILTEHAGRLPLEIRAVPEGLVVPTHNVLLTVENTCDEVPWLTNALETLLMQVWYPTTVATYSWAVRRMILRYLEETGDPSLIDSRLHDFGARGVSSVESAAIGDCAHLVSFKGTDTIAGILYAREHYDKPMAGFSIPASEHSTITAWGKGRELDAYENLLEAYPNGPVSCVSDSWSVYNACENLWGGELRDKVLARNGTLVIRPDSGTPHEVVIEVLRILERKFGTTVNSKGYKELDPHVRLIQGDGIDYDEIHRILGSMKQSGFSASNIAFGSGGALLQKHDRDEQKFALKCSAVFDRSAWSDVWKDPVTDPGKASKMGRLKLTWRGNQMVTVRDYESGQDLLRTVFLDGNITVRYSLTEIRIRALQEPTLPSPPESPAEREERWEIAESHPGE